MKTHLRSYLRAGTTIVAAALAIAALPLQAAKPTVTTSVTAAKRFYHGTMNNLVLKQGRLRPGSDTTPTTFGNDYQLFGVYTSSEHHTRNAFQSLRFNYRGNVPTNSSLICEVRTQAGGTWSPWQEIDKDQLGTAIAVDSSANGWQHRLSFFADDQASSPAIQAVVLRFLSSGAPATEARQTANATHPTYRIYATREGLVGGQTANGHIIQTRDHFVALPSRTVLDCNGCSTYTVTLKNPANGLSVTEKIYDVGPWNTKDNYWHTPRAEFTSLPLGKPEAQAAYQDGFNGGKDEFGRAVSNPAGIDLADGTFWDSLGMVGNAWIDVTFNMENLTASVTVDNSAAGFTTSANWSTGTSSTDKFGTDYRYRSTASLSDAATWNVSLGSTKSTTVSVYYPQGANRSATAPYVVAHAAGTTTVNVNEQINGGQWVSLGAFNMNAGANNVKLSCWTSTGFIVVADAVRWAQ